MVKFVSLLDWAYSYDFPVSGSQSGKDNRDKNTPVITLNTDKFNFFQKNPCSRDQTLRKKKLFFVSIGTCTAFMKGDIY